MNDLKERAKKFAHRCVKLVLALHHIRGQLIRCATSIAANYGAGCNVQTKAAFSAKPSVVVAEADESNFGLEFLLEENLDKKLVGSLIVEAKELTSAFIASLITARKTKIRNFGGLGFN